MAQISAAICVFLSTCLVGCFGPSHISNQDFQARDALVSIVGYLPTTGTTSCSDSSGSCLIFITQSGYGATGVDSPTTFNGLAGADAKCISDANYPGKGVFKAMLREGTTRLPTVTSGLGDGQIDWILKPSKVYKRTDGTVVGTTSNKGLFVFPLAQPVTTIPGSIWTGLAVDWLSGVNGNCTAWTATGGSGEVGTSNATSSAFLAGGGFSCSIALNLVCVEQ